MKKQFQARQGDVLIDEASAPADIPATAAPVPQDGGRVVLAYGEVTGHAHAFGGRQPLLFRAGDDALTAYLQIDNLPCSLKHEEHGPIEVPPAKHAVIQQRQWTLARQIRRVAD